MRKSFDRVENPAVHRRLLRPRWLLACGALLGSVALAQPTAAPLASLDLAQAPALPGDFSVMTYNVKGLPWPVATGREEPLRLIGERLAQMRAAERQPTIVVLQEAFIDEAKAIGRIAGYRYRVEGPSVRDDTGTPASRKRTWYRGETMGSVLDSGLVLLSDVPISDIQRQAFPAGSCGGYDCLAAKGVLMATLTLPGGRKITVATTHLNARGASGVPADDADAAYAREADAMRAVLSKRARDVPLIIARDFNRGQWATRTALLNRAVAALNGGKPPAEGLRTVMATEPAGFGARSDAQWIRMRARDLQFVVQGAGQVTPIAGAVPFGIEPDGSSLSDHHGFTIADRFAD